MKQSIGQSVSINIIVIFLVIMFAFIAGILSYTKAFKVNSNISKAIETSEGYNKVSKKEIDRLLTGLGYVKMPVSCSEKEDSVLVNDGSEGICVYKIKNNVNDLHYSYRITTYITFEIPLIGQTLRVPINSKTDDIYRFQYVEEEEGE